MKLSKRETKRIEDIVKKGTKRYYDMMNYVKPISKYMTGRRESNIDIKKPPSHRAINTN